MFTACALGTYFLLGVSKKHFFKKEEEEEKEKGVISPLQSVDTLHVLVVENRGQVTIFTIRGAVSV